MKKLYVVSTYYHGLISCVKQLLNHDTADIICTSYIPGGESLSDKIKESGIFDKTYYIGKINEYTPLNKLDYIFFYHKKNAETIEKQFTIDLSVYDEINIFHDNTWFAHYLKDKRIKYRLIEDALDGFKIIQKTPFSYMIPKNRLKTVVKRFFRIGYVYCGFDSCTISVEVNNKSDLDFLHINKKLHECSREKLMNSLDKRSVEIIKNIFITKSDASIYPSESVLLLTQALMEYGLVSDLQEQINVYKRLVSELAPLGYDLVIKPHPRDNADYFTAFPKAKILDKHMPIEALLLGSEEKFKCALMFSISTIYKTEFAQQMIIKDFYK